MSLTVNHHQSGPAQTQILPQQIPREAKASACCSIFLIVSLVSTILLIISTLVLGIMTGTNNINYFLGLGLTISTGVLAMITGKIFQVLLSNEN